MKALIILLILSFNLMADTTLHGELADAKVVNGLGSVDIKVINTENDSFIIDFSQSYALETCKYGEFDIAPAAALDTHGYESFLVVDMKCLEN